MILNKDEVTNFLPHREPFLFADEIEQVIIPDGVVRPEGRLLTPKEILGSKVIGYFRVRENLEVLKGHFPGQPIFPGVLQIEMTAQISAFLALAIIPKDEYKKYSIDTKLVSVDRARFRKEALPPERLRVESILVKSRGCFNQYETKAFNEKNELISECAFMASVEIIEKNPNS
ncbi:beta-hydroxyacyl-ACP dehydratase [Bacteriovoracaceae bacterium]|nr:beta-hydroxyacyl-ACP dehydratase [Bacteriovoracaceae bacterium]